MEDPQAQAEQSDTPKGDDLENEDTAHDLQSEAIPSLKDYDAQLDGLDLGDYEVPDGTIPGIVLDEDEDAPDRDPQEEEEEEQPPNPEEEEEADPEEELPGETEIPPTDEEPPPSNPDPDPLIGRPGSAQRITPQDAVEVEALRLKRLYPKFSLSECEAKARLVLGVEAASPSGDQQEEAPAARTAATVSAEIKELLTKKHAHLDALEYDEANELEKKIDDLRLEATQLTITEQTAGAQAKATREKQQAEQFETEFSASGLKAAKLYPDCTDPNSAFTKKMEELDRLWEENDDPLFHSSDKPFLLAREAGKLLGVPMAVLPKTTAAPATTTTPPAKKTAKNRPPFQPAGGNASTTQPTSRTATVDAEIAGLDSEAAYEDFLGRFSRRR